MPELPEVGNLILQLRPRVQSQKIKSVWLSANASLVGSRNEVLKALPGQTIAGLERRGKYIGMRLSGGRILWIHLGMTGQLFFSETVPQDDPHLHLTVAFQGLRESFFLRDVRRFGKLSLSSGEHDILLPGLKQLGPDPLEIDEDEFIRSLKNRRSAIKGLLLNQKLVSGIGNIYADESLFRAGVHPGRKPVRITKARLARLHASIQETLKEAIDCGGSSIDDYRHVDGCQGSFQEKHQVYGREGQECFSCRTQIRMVRIAGRSSSFCPACQT